MRTNRLKSPLFKYHIRVRGLDEILLFRDNDDKSKYLSILKKYKKIHHFKLYGYCFMNTHGHFFIDPKGYDISKIMHKVNLSYAKYYNKKYNRGGPVFRGRFESNPVCSNSYCLALSAYIHNNPKDIPEFRGKEEYFYFSSYGIYAGLRENIDGLVDTAFIFSLMLMKGVEEARMKYLLMVKKQRLNNSIKNIIDCLSTGEIRIPDETLYSVNKN